jgi:hypothetical protein
MNGGDLLLVMDESVRLRAILDTCEAVLKRAASETEAPGFIKDVERLRDDAKAKLAQASPPRP